MATATKADIVNGALRKLGIVDLNADVDPGEIRNGLVVLEEMMAYWDAQGTKLGYNFSVLPEEARGEDTLGVPDIARQAMAYHLAIFLADSYGKQITQSIMLGASTAMQALLAAIAWVPMVKYGRRMPRGSGNTLRWTRYNRFYRDDYPYISADNAGPLSNRSGGVIPYGSNTGQT